MVGTSTRRLLFGCDGTLPTAVRIFTPLALPSYVRRANHEMQLGHADRKSKEEDKCAGDYQCEHPEQIDVEPGAAQHANPELFVN